MGFFSERAINRTTRQNKNWIIVFTGETGSGKSYASLSAACEIQKDFSVTHIVGNATEFIRLLESGKLKKGDVILVDEAGITMAAQEHWSEENKIILSVMQTFRDMNLVLILATPYLSFIDPDSRKLIHMQFEMQTINYDEGISRAKPYRLKVVQSGPRMGKIYRMYLKDHDGISVKIAKFKKPPEYILKDYDIWSKNYKVKIRQDASDQIDANEAKKKMKMAPTIIVKDILDRSDKERFIVAPKNGHKLPRIKMNEIEAEYNVGERTARKVRTLLLEQQKRGVKGRKNT